MIHICLYLTQKGLEIHPCTAYSDSFAWIINKWMVHKRSVWLLCFIWYASFVHFLFAAKAFATIARPNRYKNRWIKWVNTKASCAPVASRPWFQYHFGKENISPFIDDVPFPKMGHLNCRLILETSRLQSFWTNMEISPENSNMIKALKKI